MQPEYTRHTKKKKNKLRNTQKNDVFLFPLSLPCFSLRFYCKNFFFFFLFLKKIIQHEAKEAKYVRNKK